MSETALKPKYYYEPDHKINIDRIDPDALYVVNRLRESGYTAYLVGGSVRDLLTNQIPKDFDISTDASDCYFKDVYYGEVVWVFYFKDKKDAMGFKLRWN